jgi:hypothetical protein
MFVWQQYKQGLPNRVRKRGFSFVLTSIRNSEEIVEVVRIEIYAFIANRWFMVRGYYKVKFHKQERLYCRNAV